VTARAERTEHERTLVLGGTLEAPERVEVAARIEGAIVSLTADLGDRVERGDTLARITPEDFTARVAETSAELSQARSELTRTEQLVRNELATAEALERSRTHVRVAESQRALANRQLRDTRVVAPFDGAIAERLVSPGAFVRVGTPLFLLVATSPLRLAIDVPERLASVVREGTDVTVESEANAQVSAQITRVAPIVDPATRTFRALIEIPQTETTTLRPGMYVRARIDLGHVDAVRLPRQAVFEVLGRSRVVLIVDGRAQPHDIELVDEDEGAAIVRGIAAGSEVVARGPGLLAPGTQVRAEEPTTESGTAESNGAPNVAAPAREDSAEREGT
jgi:RND family efflux transporter MFP subunit